MNDSPGKVCVRKSLLLRLSFVLALLACTAAADPAPQRIERGEFAFAIGPTPTWVKPLVVAQEWDAKAPGAAGVRWRNWLVDNQSRRIDGQRASYYDRAYEPVSAEMLTEAGKFQLEFNPEFQQLTVHELSLRRDGEWHNRLNPDQVTLARRESEFEQDMATGSVSALFLLDDVRAGDVVRMRYTVVGENPILDGLDNDGAGFAWADPTLDRQFRILFDRDAAPLESRDPRVPAAQINKTPEHLEWRYAAHAIAEAHDEGGYPRWYIAYPYVSVSEKRTWREVAAWAQTLYPTPRPLPADLLRRIARWRELPDPNARITAALLAVQEDVRYFGVEIGDNTHRPAEPADVWSNRRGDCKDKSRLLVAILAAMGIDANPALVSAQLGKAIAQLPPAASLFDHVIVQVHDGATSLWLDPTRTQQRGPARAQSIDDFGVALPVTPSATALVAVTPNPDYSDSSHVREHYDLGDDGSATELKISTEYLGAAANRMRQELAVGGVEALSRRYEELYRRRYGEVTTKTKIRVSDDAAKNRIELLEHYAIAEPWAAKSSSDRSIDFYSDHIAGAVSLPATMARKSPLAMHHPQENTHRIELRLPSGWSWKGVAEHLDVNDKAANFSTTRDQQGDIVSIEQKYVSRTSAVTVTRMTEHLRWRREVVDNVAPRLVVALPAVQAERIQNNRLNDLIRDVMDENKARKKQEKNDD